MNVKLESKKILENISNFTNNGNNTFTHKVKYIDLLNYNIYNNSLKGKFLNKITNKLINSFTMVFERLLRYRSDQDYLNTKKLEDIEYLVKEIYEKSPNSGENNYLKTEDRIIRLLAEKTYDTQKLVDGFKSEVLVEINRKKGSGEAIVEKEIVNENKVKTLSPIKLNIGCGRDIKSDYLNVDYRKLDGVDIVADVKDIPVEENSVTEIYAAHIIEHFTERDLKDILVYWFSLLKSEGTIRLITPNIDAMAKGYVNGEFKWERFRRIILGAQDYVGDFHFNAFSPNYLVSFIKIILPESLVKVSTEYRINGEAVEMEIHVIKE